MARLDNQKYNGLQQLLTVCGVRLHTIEKAANMRVRLKYHDPDIKTLITLYKYLRGYVFTAYNNGGAAWLADYIDFRHFCAIWYEI